MSSIADEILSYFGISDREENDYLEHYGTSRHSGRYPYGSGENPYQHSGDFLGRISELKKAGFTYTDDEGKVWTGDNAIAKSMGLTSTEYRRQVSWAGYERRLDQVQRAKSLKADGLGATEIGKRMGLSESTVRSLLNPSSEDRMNQAMNTVNFLREKLNEKGMIDVTSGVEVSLGISKERLNLALDYLEKAEGYQLKITSTKKLRVPSDENAGYITASLLKDKEFKKNVVASIEDSKSKMRRGQQQILFKQAQNALQKDPAKMSKSEKIAVYKALNLSLTNHNSQEVAAQDRFYSELKKKGYNALLDYNDKEYSSYHAKRPMIVFDTDSVKLQSVSETNPKIVSQMYKKYNAERIAKETVANTLGLITKIGNKTISECSSYVELKTKDYLK